MIRIFAFLLFFAAAAAPPAIAKPSSERSGPNVIFILCDDLGWGDLGVFYQNDRQQELRHSTPQLDTMARQGLQMRNHYCPAPVCAPSRATLLTGVHQGHAEVRDNQFDKALEDNHTLATVLRAAGYRTVLVGKYGLQGEGKNAQQWPAYPTRRGFDEFFGYVRHVDGHLHYPAHSYPAGDSENHRSPKELWHDDREISDELDGCYTTDLFAAYGKHWIAQHRRQHPEQPFFVYLAFDTPHAALQVPSTAYPEGGGIDGGVQWLGTPGKMINTAVGEIDSYRHPEYTDRGWSDVEERFATMVRRIDDTVGDLLQTLRDLQIDRETLVVFSSDNGPHHECYLAGLNYEPTSFDSFGVFDGTKRDVWEGGIRMPTLAWWPGTISAGGVDERPSQFHDWLPTFADAAGVAAPARTDGVSLLPTLTGNGQGRPSTIYIEYDQNGKTKEYKEFAAKHRGRRRGQMQVVHLDGYKGLRVNTQSHDDAFQIFDLQRDPKELKNLAGSSSEFERLGQRMKDRVLQLRMPNASAPRPYDDQPVPAVQIDAKQPGLYWRLAAGRFPYVPDVQTVPITAQGALPELFASLPADWQCPMAVELSGWLQVPESGAYTFAIRTTQGAFLRIHDCAVVDADFGYQRGQWRKGTIRLAQGLHPIRLTMLANDHSATIDLHWSYGDTERQQIPASRLFRNP